MTALVLAAALAAAAPVQKKADEQFEKAVAAARDKAIDYLKKEQNPNGDWEGKKILFLSEMHGATTALVALGLLEAGVPVKDPVIARAVEYLVQLESRKTYVVSLQTRVLARVDPKKHAKQIQKNVDWLLETAFRRNNRVDGWSYPQNHIADNSNTHFAVVALHAAAQAGATVDLKVWKAIGEFYTITQSAEGSWTYYNDVREHASNSMTACGLVGLVIAEKYDKPQKQPTPAFQKGMGLLVDMTYAWPKSTMYNMMVVAELGRLLDTREFEAGGRKRPWYREGAETLVNDQKADGSWSFGRQVDASPHLATAMGLYFLGPPPKDTN